MQQMREAFPWDEAPRYVPRDRDRRTRVPSSNRDQENLPLMFLINNLWKAAGKTLGHYWVVTKYKYARGSCRPLKSSSEAFLSTHNPTHIERCLVRVTRSLAVPACLISCCNT